MTSKISIVFAFSTLLTFSNFAVKNKTFSVAEITVLPKLLSLDVHQNSFAFKESQAIFSNLDEQQSGVKDLKRNITETENYKLFETNNKQASIIFEKKAVLNVEAYELVWTSKKIIISAYNKASYFYGVKTQKQLIPIENSNDTKEITYLIPAVSIQDYPRFNWRAYMLNQMELLKMNTFDNGDVPVIFDRLYDTYDVKKLKLSLS